MLYTGLRVSPATNGKEDLEVSVGKLDKVELLKAAVKVVARFIPRVAREVFL